jgi:hypothetical protein
MTGGPGTSFDADRARRWWIMDHADRSSRRSPLPARDHLIILGCVALTLLLFHESDDPVTGKGTMTDAAGYSTAFLLTGYYVRSLPALWAVGERGRSGSLILPLLIALALVYFYLAFRAYFIQPGAAILSILMQLFVLTYLSARA